MRSLGLDAVNIFMLPPSFEVLEQRLRGRSKDSEEAIRRRLATARAEVDAVVDYDYVVVNDELVACVERLSAIVLSERARLRRMKPVVAEIVKSFATSERAVASEPRERSGARGPRECACKGVRPAAAKRLRRGRAGARASHERAKGGRGEAPA